MPDPLIQVNANVILTIAKTIPSSARMYARMQKALQDPDCDLDQIIDLVRLDTGLCAGVIQISNSAASKRGETITTIEEAISRVGLREVQRLVGLTVSKQMFSRSMPLYRVGTEALWHNSLCVAHAASCLAQNVDEDAKIGYTMGMMRPIGRLVLQETANASRKFYLQPVPEKASFERTRDWEIATFGVTQDSVIGTVLTEWGFPPAIRDPLMYYFNPALDPDQAVMTAVMHIACAVADSLGKGLPCEFQSWTLSDELLEQAGLSRTVVETSIMQTRVELAEALETYYRK